MSFDTSFKKPDKTTLQEQLTALQYFVTQEDGTEPAFKNEFWDYKAEGIYVDIVSGEPLFSSKDKYDSGSGWPSFTKSLHPELIVEHHDERSGMHRTEVRSKYGDSHLGHVFDDGPPPTRKRYCINSAALRFVPVAELVSEGFSVYASDFGTQVYSSTTINPASPPTTAGISYLSTATLAGGCFWGVEELFRQLPGVLDTDVGYTGGHVQDPGYERVKTGGTGHAEALQVVFDSRKISYEQILQYFFRLHDPTTLNQQGNDRGTQYRSAIFYHDFQQRHIAEKVKTEVNESGKWKKPVLTEIVAASTFFVAEDYHQDYLQKNPHGYTCHYLRE